MCCQGQLIWLKRTLKNFPIHGSTKALIEGAHWRWICMQESHGRPWPGGRNRIKPQPKTREKAENQICTCSGWKAKGRATQAEAHSESYSGPIRNASGTTNPANSQCWCVKHIEGWAQQRLHMNERKSGLPWAKVVPIPLKGGAEKRKSFCKLGPQLFGPIAANFGQHFRSSARCLWTVLSRRAAAN